jgi:hypothetical protein
LLEFLEGLIYERIKGRNPVIEMGWMIKLKVSYKKLEKILMEKADFISRQLG